MKIDMTDSKAVRDALVSGIFEQTKGEEEAKMNYMKFLACYGKKLQDKDREAIEEIIADEQNHSLILLAMSKKYSRIKPTDDGLAEALKTLSE